MLNNYNIQTGRLFDEQNKNFDITVILNFPTQADFDNHTGLDDFPSVNLVDFYFGEPETAATEYYVKQYIERQANFRKLISKLIDLSTTENESELAEHIEFVKSLIAPLH